MKSRAAALSLAGLAVLAGAGGWWFERHGHGARGSNASQGATTTTVTRACAPTPSTAGAHPGMAWVPDREFRFGSDAGFPEEGPATTARVAGFWMDQTEVTNAQFAAFVAATGYRTLAERGVRRSNAADAPTVAGSAVFRPRGDGDAMRSLVNWWQFMPGADWRHPDGPGTSIDGRDRYPVVHVAYEDALAYAQWKGHALPTEEQFESAAQGSGRKSAAGELASNTWQGSFPAADTAADGFKGAAPVACYAPNSLGLYDLIGNVWEWTRSAYFDRHDSSEAQRHPGGFDPTQPDERDVAVVKGGSFLCSPDYCMRYRPEARLGQSKGLGTQHIGFRTVLPSG